MFSAARDRFYRARQHSVTITFREHMRIGVPVTAISLFITLIRIRIAG